MEGTARVAPHDGVAAFEEIPVIEPLDSQADRQQLSMILEDRSFMAPQYLW